MKKALVVPAIALFIILFVATSFGGDVYVRGYYRSDGTYVQPHYRSAPDGNPWNNFSTYGNVNPYTGQPGYRRPDSYYGNSYGQGYTRPRYRNPYGSGLLND